MVISRITAKKITVFDPAGEKKHISYADFLKEWTGYVLFFTPNEHFTVQKETVGLFARFLPLFRPYIGVIAQILTASLLLTVFGILASLYFRSVIDDVVYTRALTSLTAFSIGILFLTLLQAELFRHTPQFSLLYRQPLTRGLAAFSAETRAVQTRFEIFKTMQKQTYNQFMKTLLESIAELDTMRTHTEYYRLNAVYHTAKYDEIEKKRHTGNAAALELLDAKRNMLKAQQEYELNRTAFTLKEKAFTVRYGDSALVLHETDKDTLADFLHCTDTRDNYEAQLLTGKKQLLDAELLSVKKDEAPQLLVKFSAVPDELVFRFSSDYGTSWELLSHNVPWIFHASIGIVWSPDYFSRAAAKSELLKNRSSLIDLQLHELHEQRQHETLLLREKIASVEQAYGLMQQYTAEQASLLKEYRRLYEEHSITESAYEQINAEYALQVYLQAQAFWQLIAAKAEYLFL